MRFCDGGIEGGSGEGFNIRLNVWGNRGKKIWRKVEARVKANGFKLGISGYLR